MRVFFIALALCGCIGPTVIDSRDEGGTRRGIVHFRGREGLGYVTAKVMEQRQGEAVALARSFCDGGVEIVKKRSDGFSDNYVDFTCTTK